MPSVGKSRSRVVGLGLVGLLACATSVVSSLTACSEKKGGLMLAISTDMKAPKDVNVITLSVLVNNQVKVNYQGRVTPDGKVLLPATVALAEPSDPNASVRIRVVAFRERKARVLRDVRTTVPTGGRIALLRIPLNFVNDGLGAGELPVGMVIDDKPISDVSSDGGAGGGGGSSSSGGLGGSFGAGEYNPYEIVTGTCPLDQTVIDGECADDYVDSSTLPEYDESLVGRGDDPGVCFDAAKCFANAVPVSTGQNGSGGAADAGAGSGGDRDAAPAPVDAGADGKDFFARNVTLDLGACAVNLNGADASKLNLALVTPDTGECLRPNECYVPLDKGAGGWRDDNGRVQLPKFVCKLLDEKNLRLFASEGTCSAKTESNPVCASTAGEAARDGGKPGLPDGGAASGPQLFIAEPFATTVKVGASGTLYFAGEGRFGRQSLAGTQPATGIALPPGAPTGRQPWVLTQSASGELALTTATSPNAYVQGPDGPPQALIVGQVPVNGGVATSSGFAFGVGGVEGGIYRSIGTDPAVSFAAAGGADVTAVAGGGQGFVFGTGDGQVRGCSFELDTCGQSFKVGATRVDGFALDPRPQQAEYGYILLQDEIVRAQMFTQTGTMNVVGRRPAESVAFAEGGHFARAIATAPPVPSCLVFTSTRGVEWMNTDLATGGIIVPQPLAKPALGIALGPGDAASATTYVYYAVFASMTDGGGIWRVPLPKECGAGSGGGGGSDDAGQP